jgi:hypothetical protein
MHQDLNPGPAEQQVSELPTELCCIMVLCVQEALFQYAREAADFATKGQLPHLGQTLLNRKQFFWFHLLEYLQLYEFPEYTKETLECAKIRNEGERMKFFCW